LSAPAEMGVLPDAPLEDIRAAWQEREA